MNTMVHLDAANAVGVPRAAARRKVMARDVNVFYGEKQRIARCRP